MGKHVVSLETDLYIRRRASPRLHPFIVQLCLSFLVSVGRRHFYFPLSFITSGTLPADMLEKDAQKGVDARILFFLSSQTFSFRGAARKVENLGWER